MGTEAQLRLVVLILFALGFGASVTLRRRADRRGGTLPRSADLLVLAAGTATFAVILVRTRHEEDELVSVFGDRYLEYMDRTGRVLPRIGRARRR